MTASGSGEAPVRVPAASRLSTSHSTAGTTATASLQSIDYAVANDGTTTLPPLRLEQVGGESHEVPALTPGQSVGVRMLFDLAEGHVVLCDPTSGQKLGVHGTGVKMPVNVTISIRSAGRELRGWVYYPNGDPNLNGGAGHDLYAVPPR